MKNEILRMEHIYLNRKGVLILEDFKLNILEGEFVVLYGNFGCGRKEISDFLAGKIPVTSGKVYINEKKLGPKEQFMDSKYGVVVISDSTGLIPCLTVAENIFLSWKKNIFSFTLSQKLINRETEQILNLFGAVISPNKLASELSVMDQLIVKLAKAYCRKMKLVVMDEIADIYSPAERARLFSNLKFMQSKGISILWITGKCMNSMPYMDKMVIMRHGRNVLTFFDTPEDKESINKLVDDTNHTRKAGWIEETTKQEIFRINGNNYHSENPIIVNKGECVGIVFDDTKELEHFSNMLLGKRKIEKMNMWFNNIPYVPISYQHGSKQGICEIDMLDIQNNLFHNLSVKENLVVNSMQRTSIWKLFINRSFMEFVFMKYREHFKVNNNLIDNCSWKERENIIFFRLGINTSKLIVATEFWAHVDDARWNGLIDHIQNILNQNKSFLFLSVNISELKQVCNRIYFFREGNVELYRK